MANIRGLVGFNPSSGTARLFAAFGNDIVNVTTNTGYSLNLNSTNDVEFEKFLDRVFFQNYSNIPKTYNTSTNVWSNRHVGKVPLAKYLKKYKSRLYIGYSTLSNGIKSIVDSDGNNIIFPSKVFYSDLAGNQSGNFSELTWGLEWGAGQTTTDPNLIRYSIGNSSPGEFDFIARNIKVGDPIFIVQSDTNRGSLEAQILHVREVGNLYLKTVESLAVQNAVIQFWVGSNWFDVSPDDGDVITGFGENSNRLLIFKLLSLWFYTGSQLIQVKGAPGTSYNRSVINDQYGNTYYFHGSDPKISGIYKYNGVSAVRISRAIDPWISAMAVANYTAVVAWQEGNELRWYLGNLSAGNLIDALNNAVATYNIDTGAWSVDPIQHTITASTVWRASGNQQDSYTGNSVNQVMKMASGNSILGTAFPSYLQTKIFYPAGSEIICDFLWVQIVGRYTRGTRVKYKLWDIPQQPEKYSITDQEWNGLGELEGDLTEFILPIDHKYAAGIQFQFDELGIVENDTYIEKISLFYKANRTRLI